MEHTVKAHYHHSQIFFHLKDDHYLCYKVDTHPPPFFEKSNHTNPVTLHLYDS